MTLQQHERLEPSLKAKRQCAEWLKTCLDLGWPKSALDDLERLWWKHHDERGRLVTEDANDATTI